MTSKISLNFSRKILFVDKGIDRVPVAENSFECFELVTRFMSVDEFHWDACIFFVDERSTLL